jgi:hypothetical protein
MISVVNNLRTIAKAVPLASPGIQEINEIISAKVMPAIMQSQKTAEPAAPPMNG